MVERYRGGGVTPALGPAPVNYVEGRCLGGGSEKLIIGVVSTHSFGRRRNHADRPSVNQVFQFCEQ